MPQKLYKALAKVGTTGETNRSNRPGSGRSAYGVDPHKKGKQIKYNWNKH